MSWMCASCGFKDHKAGATACEVCGTIPGTLVLRGKDGSGELAIRAATDVGQRLLAGLVGEDRRFLSEVQFHVRKDDGRGAWVVQAAGGATNRSHCNGRPLGDDAEPLGLGSEITVGPRGHACVRVHFDA
jgi:hypothetical protein